jgi:ligand-binding sensor domain-containing protein
MKIWSLFIMLLCFQACHSQAQNTEDSHPKLIIPVGTSQYATISCSMQDKSGNIWFGTTGAGVYRYDGKGFVNFLKKDGLNSKVVYAIIEDFKGNIWVSTNEGVCQFDGKKFVDFPLPWTRTPIYSRCMPAANKIVLSMLQDKMGNMWFGTQDEGVFQYNGKTFTQFLANEGPISKTDGLHHSTIPNIYQEKSGIIWFGSFRYDGNKFKNFPQPEYVTDSSDRIVRSYKDMLEQNSMFSSASVVLEDKKGNLWFRHGCRYGLTKYDGKTLSHLKGREGIGDNVVTTMAIDNQNNLWIGGTEKEHRNLKDGFISIYDGQNFKPFSTEKLKNSAIENIFVDKANNIWISTRELGLYRYDGKEMVSFTEKPVEN